MGGWCGVSPCVVRMCVCVSFFHFHFPQIFFTSTAEVVPGSKRMNVATTLQTAAMLQCLLPFTQQMTETKLIPTACGPHPGHIRVPTSIVSIVFSAVLGCACMSHSIGLPMLCYVCGCAGLFKNILLWWSCMMMVNYVVVLVCLCSASAKLCCINTLCCVVLRNVMLCCARLSFVVLCCIVLCHVLLCCTVLCNAVLCSAVLFHAVRCCATFWHCCVL